MVDAPGAHGYTGDELEDFELEADEGEEVQPSDADKRTSAAVDDAMSAILVHAIKTTTESIIHSATVSPSIAAIVADMLATATQDTADRYKSGGAKTNTRKRQRLTPSSKLGAWLASHYVKTGMSSDAIGSTALRGAFMADTGDDITAHAFGREMTYIYGSTPDKKKRSPTGLQSYIGLRRIVVQ